MKASYQEKSPAPDKNSRRYLRYALIAVAIVTILLLVFVDVRYGVLLPTLRAEPEFTAEQTAVQLSIDPAAIAPLLPDVVAPVAGRWPGWVLRRFTPYGAGGVAQVDFGAQTIVLTGYLNSRRLAPLIAREAADVDLQQRMRRIRWNGPAYEARPGLLIADGTIRLDPDAEESFGYMWDQGMTLPPLTLEGGHFVEAVFDNRRGYAYLAFASFVQAYDINLAENQHEIELASLQFVREARFTMDFAPPDSFDIRFVLDIAPDAIDRLGVINLKVGIEDAFANVAGEWDRKFGIEVNGEGRWEGTTIVYEYELESAREWLGLIRDGKLN